MPEMNRRSFLITAAAATAAAVISLPVLQAHADDVAPADHPGTPADVGLLSSFDKDGVTDKWAKSGKFFVIREDGHLYAPTAICTHKGAAITSTETELFCPKHKSHFSYQGTVTGGPAKRSLPRYAISVDANGHVLVDKSKQFTETQWDDPKSFVAVGKPK